MNTLGFSFNSSVFVLYLAEISVTDSPVYLVCQTTPISAFDIFSPKSESVSTL